MQTFDSQLGQLLLNSRINNRRETVLDRVRYSLSGKIQRWLLRAIDPTVQFEIAGTSLHAPLSHALPHTAAAYPNYNNNLTRIAGYISDYYPDLSIIDIGANIGDSVAYIRRSTRAPILCLEGNSHFFRFLRQNTADVKDIVTELVFVGAETGQISAHVHREVGTSRLQVGHGEARQIATKSLAEIVAAHPLFLPAKLLKIDTDGFDLPILRGALNFLAKSRPALFFEYDPAYFLPLGDDGISIFPQLRKIGYRSAIIYDNLGELLLTCSLDAQDTLEDIHRYFTGHGSARYCDICIFAEEDQDLADTARKKEREFFQSQYEQKVTAQKNP